MYAVVRTYYGPGAKDLFDLLENRKAEVEAAIRSVPGLVSYTLVRTEEGGVESIGLDRANTGISVKTLLGSDSHTRAAGSLGMLAIGAGGFDVTLAISGEPFPVAMPRIFGVELDWRAPRFSERQGCHP